MGYTWQEMSTVWDRGCLRSGKTKCCILFNAVTLAGVWFFSRVSVVLSEHGLSGAWDQHGEKFVNLY